MRRLSCLFRRAHGFTSVSRTMTSKAASIEYPIFKRLDTTYELHGETIADPYSWLEDPDSRETQNFVELQNKISSRFIQGEKRDIIYQNAEMLLNVPRRSAPTKRGDWYYYSYNTGLQNQDVVYRTKDFKEDGEVFLNPNEWSEDGTVAISGTSYTKDGSILALSISKSGSDWKEIEFRRTDTDANNANPITDKLTGVKFGGATWTPSKRGVIYPRYKQTGEGTETTKNEDMQLWYHKIGTPQAEDVKLLDMPSHPEWMFGPGFSFDGQYFFIFISASCDSKEQVWVAETSKIFSTITDEEGNVTEENVIFSNAEEEEQRDAHIVKSGALRPLVGEFKSALALVGVFGHEAVFTSTLNAPRGHVVKVDLKPLFADEPVKPIEEWDVIVPEAVDGGVLEDVTVSNKKNHFLFSYLRDACSSLQLFATQFDSETATLTSVRKVKEFDLGQVGTLTYPLTREDNSEVFFKFTTYTAPGSIYRLNLADEEEHEGKTNRAVTAEEEAAKYVPELIQEIEVAGGLDLTKYTVEQDFVPAKDFETSGARIPVFVVRNKDHDFSGSTPAPTILYGYGGFKISLTPGYSSLWMTFLESFPNAAVCVACMRGGGEYGEDWYQSGVKDKKQNVFDDFFSVAEYLTNKSAETVEHASGNNKGLTSRSHLVCMGGSNGGTLVGAAVTQRPELFGAAICQVPVMDMFKFHKFTIGHAWVSDFGNPEIEEEFQAIKKWSPLHNISKKDVIEPSTASQHGTENVQAEWPALLVLTADHDDRVVPLHAFKFIAQAQHTLITSRHYHHISQLFLDPKELEDADEANNNLASDAAVPADSGNEVIIARIDVKAGHGAGKSTAQRIAETADTFGFVAEALDIKVHYIKKSGGFFKCCF